MKSEATVIVLHLTVLTNIFEKYNWISCSTWALGKKRPMHPEVTMPRPAILADKLHEQPWPVTQCVIPSDYCSCNSHCYQMTILQTECHRMSSSVETTFAPMFQNIGSASQQWTRTTSILPGIISISKPFSRISFRKMTICFMFKFPMKNERINQTRHQIKKWRDLSIDFQHYSELTTKKNKGVHYEPRNPELQLLYCDI